jgi:hypothetical protein
MLCHSKWWQTSTHAEFHRPARRRHRC